MAIGCVLATVLLTIWGLWVWFLSEVIVYLFGIFGVNLPLWVAFGVLTFINLLVSGIFRRSRD